MSRPGRRKMQNDLNLVPFIDLFSTLIIFLISTAVWDQLAALKMNLGAQDKATVEAPKEDLKKVTSNVKITVSNLSIELFDEGKIQKIQRATDEEEFDVNALRAFMQGLREKYPQKRDMLVFATDIAVYKDVVVVLDESMAQQFDELIVTGQEQRL